MIRSHLQTLIGNAVSVLVGEGKLPAVLYEAVEISDPRSPEHGDYASNFALVNAKKAAMSPRALGELLAAALAAHPDLEEVEVAGPGFLNLRLKPEAISRYVADVLAAGDKLSHSQCENPQKINVEFVSVNPNGPITVASGRGAAFGSALCNVLCAAGHQVHREYYVNDGVNSEQMRLFAESVKSYVEGLPFPEKGYKGDYVQAVAQTLRPPGEKEPEGRSLAQYQAQSQAVMLKRQRADLTAFGVEFDTWFSEQSLHDSGAVDACVNQLKAHGVADLEPVQYAWLAEGAKGRPTETPHDEEEEYAAGEQVPAPDEIAAVANPPRSTRAEFRLWAKPQANTNTLWLRSTRFGDDLDRVVRRRDGRLTYIASDVAYHKDKFNRPENADKLLTILGPDHHGYIGRLQAVVAALLRKGGDTLDTNKAALDEARRRLEVVIFQIVRFMKEGKQAPMRKRDGNIYALIDLIDELGKTMAPSADLDEQRRIGRDVARFFYLMRSHDTHLDFDIDLATTQTDENPVFYAQYAHARICSVMRKAEEGGMGYGVWGMGSQLDDGRNPAGDRKSEIGDQGRETRDEGGTVPSREGPVSAANRGGVKRGTGDHTPGIGENGSNQPGDSATGQSGPDAAEGRAPQTPDPTPHTPHPTPYTLLTHPKELALIKKIVDLPWEVRRCADDYGVHRLTTYAVELARSYHGFYDNCRVILPEQPELSQARLALCEATRLALRSVFEILGISAPERMERE